MFDNLILKKILILQITKKVSRGIEPLKKVLTVPRINHSAMIPYSFYFIIS